MRAESVREEPDEDEEDEGEDKEAAAPDGGAVTFSEASERRGSSSEGAKHMLARLQPGKSVGNLQLNDFYDDDENNRWLRVRVDDPPKFARRLERSTR